MLKTRHNTYKVGAAGLVAFVVAVYIVERLKPWLGMNNLVRSLIVGVIGLLIVYIVVSLTIGRDAVVEEQPCDYPPEKLTPIQAGLIIDGVLNERDVTSTFFYMAQKGYFRIEEYALKEFRFVYGKYPESEPKVIQHIFETIFDDRKAVDNHRKALRAYFEGAITEEELKKSQYVVPLVDELTHNGADRRLVVDMPKIKDMAFNSIDRMKNREIADITGKLIGFKNSIINTRGEEAESLIRGDADYIWKVLPYAYALSVSTKLPKKVPEEVEVILPDWYSPYGVEPGTVVDVVLYNAINRNLADQLHKEVFEFVFSRYANMIAR